MPSFTYLFGTQVPNSTSELGQSPLSHCNVTAASVQKGGTHLSLVVIGTHCKKTSLTIGLPYKPAKNDTFILYVDFIYIYIKKTTLPSHGLSEIYILIVNYCSKH